MPYRTANELEQRIQQCLQRRDFQGLIEFRRNLPRISTGSQILLSYGLDPRDPETIAALDRAIQEKITAQTPANLSLPVTYEDPQLNAAGHNYQSICQKVRQELLDVYSSIELPKGNYRLDDIVSFGSIIEVEKNGQRWDIMIADFTAVRIFTEFTFGIVIQAMGGYFQIAWNSYEDGCKSTFNKYKRKLFKKPEKLKRFYERLEFFEQLPQRLRRLHEELKRKEAQESSAHEFRISRILGQQQLQEQQQPPQLPPQPEENLSQTSLQSPEEAITVANESQQVSQREYRPKVPSHGIIIP